MNIVNVDSSNQHIYLNLAQAYEAEFSRIMQKKPDEHGRFGLDTELGGVVRGYLLYIDESPAGHCAIAEETDGHFEVCDFYVVPYFRGQQTGQRFIAKLFADLGGRWEIKQVAGAEHAIHFWRKVINHYTRGHFTEDVFNDPKWGLVTRQRFDHHQSFTQQSFTAHSELSDAALV